MALQALIFFKETGSSDFPAEKQLSTQPSGWDQEGEYVRSAAISLVESGSTPLIYPTGGKTAKFCCGVRIKKKYISELGFVFRLSENLHSFAVWWSLNPCFLALLLKLSGTEPSHRVTSLV